MHSHNSKVAAFAQLRSKIPASDTVSTAQTISPGLHRTAARCCVPTKTETTHQLRDELLCLLVFMRKAGVILIRGQHRRRLHYRPQDKKVCKEEVLYTVPAARGRDAAKPSGSQKQAMCRACNAKKRFCTRSLQPQAATQQSKAVRESVASNARWSPQCHSGQPPPGQHSGLPPEQKHTVGARALLYSVGFPPMRHSQGSNIAATYSMCLHETNFGQHSARETLTLSQVCPDAA